jgi:hypothetical protein
MVATLCYKPEGHGFKSPCRILPVFLIVRTTLGPGVYAGSNRNEYQKQKKKTFLGSGLTTSPPSVS